MLNCKHCNHIILLPPNMAGMSYDLTCMVCGSVYNLNISEKSGSKLEGIDLIERMNVNEHHRQLLIRDFNQKTSPKLKLQ